MKFLTSPVPSEFIDVYSDSDYFKGTDGKYYYYQVSVDQADNCITIADTVGRSVPVGMEELASLANVLNKLVRFNKQKAYFDEFNLHELLQGAST